MAPSPRWPARCNQRTRRSQHDRPTPITSKEPPMFRPIRTLAFTAFSLTAVFAGLVVGSTASASAAEIRGRCDGTLTIAANYRAGVNHEGNHVFNPGSRDQVAVRLNSAGHLRWFCNSEATGLARF